jgi:1,4-alpha-glucan branching enzyme
MTRPTRSLPFCERVATTKDQILCLCNFTPVPRYDYRIGAPREGFYSELLNTDASIYGGQTSATAAACMPRRSQAMGSPFRCR